MSQHPLEPHAGEQARTAADAHIALLDADPGFATGIPADDLALATRVLVLPRFDLDAGGWTPPAPSGYGDAPLALLVDGVVGRHVGLGDRVATQLLGPSDVFDPWPASSDALLPAAVTWSAYGPATVAVLDGRFATVAQRWPALSRTAHARLAALGERVAVHLAISQLPRVEDRIVALLWHLAERFGQIAMDGVIIDVRLTHRLIGELVGAQRPTVSLALSSLLDEGRVRRRDDGRLVLDSSSRGALDPTGVPAPLPADVPVAATTSGDLSRRVHLLRVDAAARQRRTIATVTRSAALRAARQPRAEDEADGAAA